MTNYKRFITYLYFYESGKKMENVGFARVETSDEIGKITIHCSTKVVPGKECKVYLLKRTKSMTISKQVATATSLNGNLDIKLSFDGGRVNDSEFNLKDTQGVVILYSKDNYIAAKWDDSSVSYHEVILLEQEEEIQQPIPKIEAAQVEKNEEKAVELQPKIVMVDAADIINLGKVSDIKKAVEYKEDIIIPVELKSEDRKDQMRKEVESIVKEDKVSLGEEAESNISEAKPTERSVVEGSIVKDSAEEGRTLTSSMLDNIIIDNNTVNNSVNGDMNTDRRELEDNADENKALVSKAVESKVPSSSEFNRKVMGNRNATNWGFERNTNTGRNMRPIHNNLAEARAASIGNNVETSQEVKKSIKDIIRENIRAEKEKEGEKVLSEDMIASDEPQAEEIPIDDTELKEEDLHAANCAVPNPNLWADHPSARAILNRFVRMYPFDDGEIAECVRLEPKDIGLLPMSAWVLGNNSFLLHSYCNFRHLLFAKKLTREGCVYLLMVPGAHNNREQQLAKMFGFENFKCSRRRSIRDGEFGYWYVPIVFE